MTAEIAPAWYIKTRAEFFEVLARTLKAAQGLSALGPFWAHASIAAQLQAMTDWTAAGRTPTPEERDRITIGLIAIREFDAQPVDQEADFIETFGSAFRELPDDAWPPRAFACTAVDTATDAS